MSVSYTDFVLRLCIKVTIKQFSYRPLGTKNKITAKSQHVFLCWSCEQEFVSVRDLKLHLEQAEHDIISIGCKWCDYRGEMLDIDSTERYLVLHTFSKVHLYNRNVDIKYI